MHIDILDIYYPNIYGLSIQHVHIRIKISKFTDYRILIILILHLLKNSEFELTIKFSNFDIKK